MRKLTIAALAGVFGTAATFGMLFGGATQPAQADLLQATSSTHVLVADDENERGNNENENENENDQGNRGHRGNHGNQDCVNPAGHTRGWCKNGNNQGNRNRNRGGSTISGTVVGINGNVVGFQLDNGQTISILDNNGTQLNVGQHYRLRGNYQNGQFVLGGNGYNNGGYNNNGGNNNGGYNNNGNGNASVSGNIVATGNGTITLLGVPPVVINVQQAINNNATNGSLSIGRHVTAYGYYSNNVFYATSIQ